MAITQSTIYAGLRQPYRVLKASQTAEGAGTFHSLWKAAGNPTAGANPPLFSAGSGYVPTRATTGAVGQANAAGGNQLRLASITTPNTTTAGMLIVYDRLWHCSGLGTVVTTLQSVTTPGTLPSGRLRDGVSDDSDVEMFLEVYTAPGATGANWTIVAPDGGGTNRNYVYAHPANAESVGQMIPLSNLAPAGSVAGHSGPPVSFQASVSSGTAGDVGITMLRRIAEIPVLLANVGGLPEGPMETQLSRIYDDACLALAVQCSATSTGLWTASLGLTEITP